MIKNDNIMKLKISIFLGWQLFFQNDAVVIFFENNNKVVIDKSKAKNFGVLTK
jgi:hypothetical protein